MTNFVPFARSSFNSSRYRISIITSSSSSDCLATSRERLSWLEIPEEIRRRRRKDLLSSSSRAGAIKIDVENPFIPVRSFVTFLRSNGLKRRQTSVSSPFLQISFRIDGGNGVEKVISTGRRSKMRGRQTEGKVERDEKENNGEEKTTKKNKKKKEKENRHIHSRSKYSSSVSCFIA